MPLDELVNNMVCTPPEAHACPTLFEERLTLSAAAKLELFMDVVKEFLRYTEHPLDAQPVLTTLETVSVSLWDIPLVYILYNRISCNI